MDDIHKSIENNEFESKLEAVYSGLEHCLYREQVCVFRGKEGKVEENDKNVDRDELLEDSSSLLLLEYLTGPKDFVSLPEVEAGNDGFLHCEAGHLHLFIDVVRFEKLGR